MKTILALDLGTDTGYAMSNSSRGFPDVGTWRLGYPKEIKEWGKTRMSRRCDPRVRRFYEALLPRTPQIVVFEDILFASSTYQVQLWASLRAAIWCAYGGRSGVLIECVPSSTLKKFATGHGNATKPMMQASLFSCHPEWKLAKLSDDAIDALWAFYWTEKHLKQA
jgi:Holliday junction resolvasome RuvABC endonuclease subunit